MSDASDSDEDIGEQIRISLRLSADCLDRSLEVPSDAIAVPADIATKGLSAVVNHLLGDEDQSTDQNWDFIVSKKLLRNTGVEAEARRCGISLEEAIPITYFPSLPAPQLSSAEALPDWISGMSAINDYLVTGTYDGSVQMLQTSDDVSTKIWESRLFGGPVKALDAAVLENDVWIAAGSMDHSLSMIHTKEGQIAEKYTCEGHQGGVGALCWGSSLLVSGDDSGCVALWKTTPEEPATKKSTSGSTQRALTPATVWESAHSGKVSGLSYKSSSLLSIGWDHALRVWDVDRQECTTTMSASRVLSCLDERDNMVVTGHADGSLGLWNVAQEEQSIALRKHQGWITAVKWLSEYRLASTGHDGRLCCWDVRSLNKPLHRVALEGKGLCLAQSETKDYLTIFAGGTNSQIQQYRIKL